MLPPPSILKHAVCVLSLAAVLIASGCAVTPIEPDFASTEFALCRSEALAIASGEDAARALSAARIAERCLDLSDDNDAVIHLHAMAIANYLKSGHVGQARALLDSFNQRYPHRDLYFADGTSFVDTVSVLLAAENSDGSSGNVNRTLQEEFQRKHFWETH